jgi:hypothetical protein
MRVVIPNPNGEPGDAAFPQAVTQRRAHPPEQNGDDVRAERLAESFSAGLLAFEKTTRKKREKTIFLGPNTGAQSAGCSP